MNIITLWKRHHAQRGLSTTETLATLNETLGTKHGLSRLGEWERGIRTIPQSIFAAMLADLLPDEVERITKTTLTPRQRQELRRFIYPR